MAKTTSTTPPSTQPLVAYWGPQWRSPRPDTSKYCLALAVVMFAVLAMLRYIAQQFFLRGSAGTASEEFKCAISFIKVGCFVAQAVLLYEHSQLRSYAYAHPFRAHDPIYAGLITSCLVLVTRTIALGYGPDFDLLLYAMELWFWAAYWVEWWTGIYSQTLLGTLGVF